MKKVTFITGNQDKADFLAKNLGIEIDHLKLDLDEIQSFDLKKVVENKAKSAYEIVKSPVIVDDVSVEFKALGGMPGPFIKFMLERMSFEEMCRLFDGKDTSALARCIYGYYDDSGFDFVEGTLKGRIAEKPEGNNGFGWDKVFIVDGDDKPRAMYSGKYYQTSMQKLRPLSKLRKLLDRKLN